MPKVSIIIPVFNAEKYLEKCLNSIIESLNHAQYVLKTSENTIEILLIDNDSSDNSLTIYKQYSKKYPQIIDILQCHTKGAAAVRNYGAKKAKGKYIWFIDADDYIAKTALAQLFEEIDKTKADLIMIGAKRVYKDHHTDYLSPVSIAEPNYKSRFIRYGMGPWQVIIFKKWWNEHNFSFKEGIIHEDMELMSSLILYTDTLSSIDMPLYFYRQTPESVLHRRSWNEHAYDIFPALEGLLERFKALKAEKRYHDELEWFFIWNLLIDSAKDFSQFPEGKPGFARSRKMLKKYFPNWRKNRFLREKPLKLQLRVRLNYYK